MVNFEGETYDNGLYILKESELLTVWREFKIEVKVRLQELNTQ